jgi:DNA adenine methylase
MPYWPRNTPPRRHDPLLSPLRYPGAKRRLAPYVAATLAANDIRPALFVEPFAGGASVALSLLHGDAVNSIGLVDRDPLLAAFWRTVFFDSEWLIARVRRVAVTLGAWRRWKGRIACTRRARALQCLFLNRTSFSGILTDRAGPLGGQRQASPYDLGCRFPRATLIKRIRQCAAYRDRVAFVWQADWRTAMARVAARIARGRLPELPCWYLDPPFFQKAELLYRHAFLPKDHELLRDYVLSLQDPWILSYDLTPEFARLYQSARAAHAHIDLLYSMPTRFAREVVVSNLTLPSRVLARSADRVQAPSPALRVCRTLGAEIGVA